MSPHWIAADCNFLCHHAFYGVARRDATTAVLTAILNIEAYAREFSASGVFFAFDSKPYHRSKLYPAYKAKRTKSNEDPEALEDLRHHLDKMPEYLRTLGYRSVFKERGFEADDVIAGLCKTLPQNATLTIVSRDTDLIQLLSRRVSVYDPVARFMRNRENFRTDYGIHPCEFAQAKAIAGCDSDNVSGADGIGIPTAIKYLRDDPVGPKKLEAIREWLKTPEYQRNLSLVELPYVGMPSVSPIPDEPRPHGAWRSLTESLDRPGLGSSHTDRDWRRQTCQDTSN